MATAYWFSAIDDQWEEAGNWFSNAIHTTPYGSTPVSGDDIVILGSTMPANGPSVSDDDFASWDSSGAATGTTIASGVTSPITVTTSVVAGVSGDATSAHTWAGASGGSATLTLQGGAIYAGTGTWASCTASNSADIVVDLTTTGNITCTAGVTLDGTDLICGGDVALTGATITGTVTFDVTGDITFTSVTMSSSTITITACVNLTFAGTTQAFGTFTAAACSGDLIVDDTAAISLPGSPVFTVGGDVIGNPGTTILNITLAVTGDITFTSVSNGGGSTIVTSCDTLTIAGNTRWMGDVSGVGTGISVEDTAKFVSGNITMTAKSFSDTASAGGGGIVFA